MYGIVQTKNLFNSFKSVCSRVNIILTIKNKYKSNPLLIINNNNNINSNSINDDSNNNNKLNIKTKTRRVHFTQNRRFSDPSPTLSLTPKLEKVSIIFKIPQGKTLTARVSVGGSLLDAVVDNELDIDGYGACEGTLSCSTCHVIFSKEDYDRIPNPPTEEEMDMLDLAFGLTDTSRLGCQVKVTKDMEGLEVEVPAGVADARS